MNDIVSTIVVDHEYTVAAHNQQADFNDFESYINLFDAERTEKDYDWQSDIFIPEFPARMLTQSAMDVSQYFQTRDFVECFVMQGGPDALNAADANQECINRTLNRRQLYFYHKYVRARNICNLSGYVYIKCWWEQKAGLKTVKRIDPITGEEYEEQERVIYKDYFNFEVLDSRNVFTDSNYKYSMQDKDFVIIRSKTNIDKLKAEKNDKTHKYINLDLVKELGRDTTETETEQKVEKHDKPQTVKFDNKQDCNLDKLERYGKFWYLNGEPGIDENGNVIDGATLEECIITIVKKGSSYVLIEFRKTPYKDWNGQPYRPVIRGLCYIHPTADGGVGDGKYSRELQIAINDTFNASNDRVMLATFPTLISRKYVMEDTDSFYIAPSHNIEAENPSEDVRELLISDNINGAMTQASVLKNSLDEVMSVFPGTMGNLPTEASTSATAVVGADQRSTQRSNYKSMTFENTALHELFWMITQMTWQFAKPETGEELMGELVEYFNPSLDYFYRPLSQSIESEQSKAVKIRQYNAMLGYLGNMVQFVPEPTIRKIDYITTKIFELMGDEYANVSNLETQKGEVVMPEGGMGQPSVEQGATQNQIGLPQSSTEAYARGGF